MNERDIVKLAYLNGISLKELALSGLSADNLRKIAGRCGQYAYETASPTIRSRYLERADLIVRMADSVDRMNQTDFTSNDPVTDPCASAQWPPR